jgi:hypothetical protein
MPNRAVSRPSRTRTVYLAPISPSSSLSVVWGTGRRARRVCLAGREGLVQASRAGSLSPSPPTMSSRASQRGRFRRPTAAVAAWSSSSAKASPATRLLECPIPVVRARVAAVAVVGAALDRRDSATPSTFVPLSESASRTCCSGGCAACSVEPSLAGWLEGSSSRAPPTVEPEMYSPKGRLVSPALRDST